MKKIVNQALLILALNIFIAFGFTYPLVSSFTNEIANNYFQSAAHTEIWGDQLNLVASMREQKNYLKNLARGEVSYEKELCLGEVSSCQLNTSETLRRVIFSPFWGFTFFDIFFNDPTAYNLGILASFPLTALAGWALAQYFTRKRFGRFLEFWPAATASVLVALAPFRVHQLLVGHRNGFLFPVVLFWILLFEILIDRARRLRTPELLNFPKTSIFIIQVICVGVIVYFGFVEKFFMLFLLLYSGLRFGMAVVIDYANLDRQLIASYLRNVLTPIIVGGFMAFLYSSLLFVPALKTTNLAEGRPLEVVALYSPKLGDLVRPNIQEHEHNIYMGAGLIIIIAFGFVALKQVWVNKRLTFDLGIFLMTCIFVVLALGTNSFLYPFLYKYLPGFNFSRTPSRFIFLVFALLPIMWSTLIYAMKPKFRYFWQVIFVLAILSFYTFQPISLTGLPRTIEVVANQKILFLPIVDSNEFFNSIYEFEISGANSVMINGYTPFTPTEAVDFEKRYIEQLNEIARVAPANQIEEDPFVKSIMQRYQIDKVIVMSEYLNEVL